MKTELASSTNPKNIIQTLQTEQDLVQTNNNSILVEISVPKEVF